MNIETLMNGTMQKRTKALKPPFEELLGDEASVPVPADVASVALAGLEG